MCKHHNVTTKYIYNIKACCSSRFSTFISHSTYSDYLNFRGKSNVVLDFVSTILYLYHLQPKSIIFPS